MNYRITKYVRSERYKNLVWKKVDRIEESFIDNNGILNLKVEIEGKKYFMEYFMVEEERDGYYPYKRVCTE